MEEKVWKALKIVMKRESIEDLAPFFFSRGCTGISYDDVRIGETEPLPDLPAEGMTMVHAYFPRDCNVRNVACELSTHIVSLGAFKTLKSVESVEVTDFGWAQKWKEFFTSQRIGGSIVVVPSWESYEGKGEEIVLVIDPGQAFGTGSHETTRLSMELIKDAFRGVPPGPCLDIGCGTGILGILMAKLGASRVTALDIDSQAVETSKRNVLINNVRDIVSPSTTRIENLTGHFDLIAANILPEPLVKLKGEIRRLLSREGKAILSGILNEKREWVLAEFDEAGIHPLDVKEEGMWSALILATG